MSHGSQINLNSSGAMRVLVEHISRWGETRGITVENGTSALHQMSKMMEEFAEWQGHYADLINFLQGLQQEFPEMLDFSADIIINNAQTLPESDINMPERELRDALTDDFGDMLVCMIQAMRLLGIDMTDALAVAYEEIAPRRGLMISGKFVKYENLSPELQAKVDKEQPVEQKQDSQQ